MRHALAILALGALAGCAKEVPAVSVVDTFCLTAEIKQWSVEDSMESIHEAEAHNATIAKRCGKRKVA